jgi:multiple sugar transport system ATP-binding protein
MAFPLRSRGLPKAEIRERVERTAKLLGLGEMLKRKPRALSGGQRQRVAMGRAIVREPQAFLMDEPLSNLDAKLRVQMRAEIANLQRELAATTLYVTHDQVEAMTMGTRIAVLRGGVLQQQGRPETLYDAPDNLFVATFIGAPAMNLVSARIEQNGHGLLCAVGEQRLAAPDIGPLRSALAPYVGSDVAVGIRSEHLIDPAEDRHDRPRLRGQVEFVEFIGAERLVRIRLAAKPVLADEVLEVARDIDATALTEILSDERAETASITARFAAGSSASPGDLVDVAVATDRLHFFDLTTGRAIR